MFFSHRTTNSRGVCILLNTSCNFDIKKTFQDDGSHLIILDIILNSHTLINVYGPNNDGPTFFENHSEKNLMILNASLLFGVDILTV